MIFSVFTNVEVEVSCPKPEEGRPTPTPCFCPAQKVDTSYGMFHFPKTEATYAGTVTVAPCPYGVIDLGLEPLTPFYVKAVTEAPESGAKRICRLKSNLENGELSNTAVWELDVEPEPKRCRSTVHASTLIFPMHFKILKYNMPLTF